MNSNDRPWLQQFQPGLTEAVTESSKRHLDNLLKQVGHIIRTNSGNNGGKHVPDIIGTVKLPSGQVVFASMSGDGKTVLTGNMSDNGVVTIESAKTNEGL